MWAVGPINDIPILRAYFYIFNPEGSLVFCFYCQEVGKNILMGERLSFYRGLGI